MPSEITDTELQLLSQLWAQDPSPHLTLQLADAYRQRGRLAEALPILERGLELHPDHVSILVAVGRYRLEAGDAEGAASVLRRVVDRDPGHLVANKLMVRAHVALGDRKGAADRLELYALLNDGDPDLEALRSAVESAPELAEESVGRPRLPAAFDDTLLVPAADLKSLARPQRRSLSGALNGDLFADLSSEPVQADTLTGLFQLDAAPVPASAPGPPPVEEAQDEAQGEGPDQRPDLLETPEPSRVEAPDEAQGEGPDQRPELQATPEPPRVEAPVPAESEAGRGATATLGSLYLEQGHLEDAQRTFEQVLARDPDDSEAQAGIAELGRRSGMLEDRGASDKSPRTAKIAFLQQYLSRIRAAAERLSA